MAKNHPRCSSLPDQEACGPKRRAVKRRRTARSAGIFGALVLALSTAPALHAQIDCNSATAALEVKPAEELFDASVDPIVFALDSLEARLTFGYPSGGFGFSHVTGPDPDGRIEIVVAGTFQGPSAVGSFESLVQLPLLDAGDFTLAVVLEELNNGRSQCLEQTLEVVDPTLDQNPPTIDPCSMLTLNLPDPVLSGRGNALGVQGSWPTFDPARWTVVGPRVDNRVVLELLGSESVSQGRTDDALLLDGLAPGTHTLELRQVVAATQSAAAQVLSCPLGSFEAVLPQVEPSGLELLPIVAPRAGERLVDVAFRVQGPWERCSAFAEIVEQRDERITIDLVEIPGCAAPESQLNLRIGTLRMAPGEYVVQLRRRLNFFGSPVDLSRFPVTLQGVGWADARLVAMPGAGVGGGDTMTLRLDAVLPPDCEPLGWQGTLTPRSITLEAGLPSGCDLEDPGVFFSTMLGPYPVSGFEPQRVALLLDLDNSLQTLFSGTLTPEVDQPAVCSDAEPVACVRGADGRARFLTRAWFDTGSGRTPAQVAPSGADSGSVFTFFDPDNPELFVKVLDGCGVNGRWWVFLSALTDVSFEVEVEDTELGRRWVHSHSGGGLAEPVSDIQAFPCR